MKTAYTMLDRRIFLGALGTGLLGGCAAPSMMAALDSDPREGGIGGTGIVGTLTDFGSLIVNGERVLLTRSTAIGDTRGSVDEASLRIGQNLTIEARRIDGILTASRVQITYPVTGIATQVSADGRSARVAGIRVDLELSGIGAFADGDTVVVSGVWHNSRVIASRVDRVRGTGGVILSGAIQKVPDAPYRLGDVVLEGVSEGELEPGSFARISGRYAAGRLAVDEAIPGRFTGAAGPLVALSVEGYLEAAPAAPFLQVSGLGHSFDAAARLRPFEQQRTLFTGAYIDTFVVERGLALPDALQPRRTLMRRVLEAGPGRLGRSAR